MKQSNCQIVKVIGRRPGRRDNTTHCSTLAAAAVKNSHATLYTRHTPHIHGRRITRASSSRRAAKRTGKNTSTFVWRTNSVRIARSAHQRRCRRRVVGTPDLRSRCESMPTTSEIARTPRTSWTSRTAGPHKQSPRSCVCVFAQSLAR